jgi:phosphocarrier protein
MRPITAFVEIASQFQSTVNVIKGAESFNGKSPLALLGLAAEKGTELILEADGPDCEAALEALVALLARLGEQDDTTTSP